MPRKTATAAYPLIIKRMISLFAMPLFELGEAVLTGDAKDASRHLEHYREDPIGLEAFVNHYHLDDYLDGLRVERRVKRRLLTTLAEAVVLVWSERLVRLLGERSALFYAGGRTEVILRFHVERPGSRPWLALTPGFLKKERIRVYRSAGGKVERLV